MHANMHQKLKKYVRNYAAKTKFSKRKTRVVYKNTYTFTSIQLKMQSEVLRRKEEDIEV